MIAVGDQGEVSDHIASVLREEADGIIAKAWTLICSVEERDYTSDEINGLIASSMAAFTKFTRLLEVTAMTGAVSVEIKRPNKVDKHRIDHGDFARASGDATCKVCGHVYYDHPIVVGFEWLRRACDGRLLKL